MNPFHSLSCRQRGTTLIAGSILAAMALGACGDSGSDAPSASDDQPLSLAERLFGTPADFADEQEQIEASVRACMVAKGWEYTPVDPSANSAAFNLDFSSDEFREQYGYGISTLVGESAFSAVPFEDPNQTYVQSLSETEITQYYEDLYGDLGGSFNGDITVSGGGSSIEVTSVSPEAGGAGGGDDAADTADTADTAETGAGGAATVAEDGPAGDDGLSRITPGSIGGCQGEAQKAVFGDTAPFADPELFDSLSDLEAQIAADPRVVDATLDWARCMAEAGHDYVSPEDIRSYLQDKTSEVTGGAATFSGDGAGGGAVIVVNDVSDTGVGPSSDGETTTTVDQSALDALKAEELALSKADADCATDTLDPVLDEVRPELEQRFLGEHPELANQAEG